MVLLLNVLIPVFIYHKVIVQLFAPPDIRDMRKRIISSKEEDSLANHLEATNSWSLYHIYALAKSTMYMMYLFRKL